jgi:hypothetical protein
VIPEASIHVTQNRYLPAFKSTLPESEILSLKEQKCSGFSQDRRTKKLNHFS